jgi:multidrug efflux pump subunit AcrA (membrane-fusion protein)
MKSTGLFRWATGVAVVFGLAGVTLAQSTARETAEGFTKPSEEVHAAFSSPGVVREAPVKDGDKVKAGQLLLKQEDSLDKKELERLELLAHSTARIEASEANLAVKRSVLKRKTEANKDGVSAFNEAEIEEAQNDVTLAEKQLKVSQEEQQEAKIKAEAQGKKLELLSLMSPCNGIVQKIVAHVGEWADPQNKEGAIIVVNNDPLYIEVRQLSTRQVAMLKHGQKLQVTYPEEPNAQPQEAEIFYFDPVADSTTDTRLFKLKIPNPQGKESGLRVAVKLPPEVAAAGSGTARMAGSR